MFLRSCLYCCQEIRVENMQMLRMGQHITFPGERGLRHIDKKGTQKKWYKHHAIIKEVKTRSDFSADLVLIHFWSTDGDKKCGVIETKDSYNLSTDEICIRKYKRNKYQASEVVRRAESKLGNESKYNIFTYNCEHLATWCVVGVRESRQVNFLKSFVRNLVICLIICVLWIVKTISTKPDTIVIKVAEVILLLFLYCVYYLSYRSIYFIERYAIKKIICKSCLKMQSIDLYARFILTLSIVILLKFYFRYTDEITTLITALMFYVTIGNLIKLIRKIDKNPYPDLKREIRRMSDIKIGDVISLNYEGSSYNIIVSNLPSKRTILTKKTRGNVSGIFYAPSLFHTGTIKEHCFKLDLTRHKVMSIDYSQFKTHPLDEVVARARKRLGEKKYNWFLNRSRHFCHWAKVKKHRHMAPRKSRNETGVSSDINIQSSLLIEIVEVRIREEIRIGDIIEIKSFGPFTDSGIVVHVDFVKDTQDQIFTMDVVLKKGFVASVVKMVSYNVNLRVDRIWIHRYHPVHCYSRLEYIQRARTKIGQVCAQWTQTRFLRDCIIRPLKIQK